jgi:hypothetical protein
MRFIHFLQSTFLNAYIFAQLSDKLSFSDTYVISKFLNITISYKLYVYNMLPYLFLKYSLWHTITFIIHFILVQIHENSLQELWKTNELSNF